MDHTHRNHTALPVWGEVAAQPTPTDQEQMMYLREMCELLWPPPAVVTMDGVHSADDSAAGASSSWAAKPAHAEGSEFVLVPGGRRPPLLVPAAPKVAAAAVRHYKRPTSRTARIGAKALALSLSWRVGGSVLRRRVRVDAPRGADTIEAYLQDAISPGLSVSMYLGPPRANRKPVLELLTAAGQPAGFAKIGINSLTRNLIRIEHASLVKLGQARLSEITVPEVLHYGEWHGLDVLVLSALPVWDKNYRIPSQRLATAMSEVASVDDVRQHPVMGALYLRQLRDHLANAETGSPRTRLLQALAAFEERAGGEMLTYGAWHGDWAPWNMASTDRGVLVWDWERFACGVPLGFDALHYWLQSEVSLRGRDPLVAAAECPGRAAELLAQFRIGAHQARLTAILYMAELATRYLVDRQAKAGARRGAPETWLIPAIESEVARL